MTLKRLICSYASQRLLTRHSLAREFSRNQISARPLANEIAPANDAFKRLQAGGFADWRLTVDGLVDRPGSFSIDQLQSYPSHHQITEVACEEGWSYIAEWHGVQLSHVLDVVGTQPHARYVVYFSIEPDWWESMDMADAMHPQTYLTYGMNGADLPVGLPALRSDARHAHADWRGSGQRAGQDRPHIRRRGQDARLGVPHCQRGRPGPR